MGCGDPFFRAHFVASIVPYRGFDAPAREAFQWVESALRNLAYELPNRVLPSFMAKITGAPAGSPSRHPWTEVEAKADGTWGTKTGGRTGTGATTGAMEMNAIGGTYTDQIVEMRYNADPDDGETQYFFRVPSAGTGAGGSTIDSRNAGTTTDAGGFVFLNIPTTNGSSTIIEFADATTGSDLRLKAGSTTGDVIRWNGSAWAITVPTIGVQEAGGSVTQVTTINIANTYGAADIFTTTVTGGNTWNIDFNTGGSYGDTIYSDGSKMVLGPPPVLGTGAEFRQYRIKASSSSGSTQTLDTGDWRGRPIEYWVWALGASANSMAMTSKSGTDQKLCGPSKATEETLFVQDYITVVVDGTDSGKLKVKLTGGRPPSDTYYLVSIWVGKKESSIEAADYTV